MILIIDRDKGWLKFYTMLDMDTGEVQSGSEIYVKQLMNSGKAYVENALIKLNRLVGTNGDFSRFDKIRKHTGREPIIIVTELVTTDGIVLGYKMASTKGEIATMSIQDVIGAAQAGILFNGKVKQVQGKGIHIEPINGYFPREVVR